MYRPRREMYEHMGIDDQRLKESSRLYADRVTLSHLEHLGLTQESIVLDAGSGPSPDLGYDIKSTGARYIALDTDRSAVDGQRTAGNEALIGSAINIPLHDNSVTLINSRFCLAWNTDEDRHKILDEFMRVKNPDGALIISEYDWTVADGPPAYKAFVAELSNTISEYGFDPAYGAKLKSEMSSHFDDAANIEEYCEPMMIDSVDSLKNILQSHAQSLIDLLTKLGRVDKADEIKILLRNALSEEAVNYTLPDIVTSVATFNSELPHKPKHSSLIQIASEDGDTKEVYNVQQDPLLLYACRSLVASIYHQRGYLEDESIDWPFLSAVIDPMDLRQRSTTFCTVDARRKPISSARLIAPRNNDISTLPTAKRLLDTYGTDALDIFDGNVIEMSTLVSNANESDPVLSLVTAMVQHARQNNINYILYGLVIGEPTESVVRMFGPAAHVLTKDGAPVDASLPDEGIRESGIDLRTGYLNTDTFFRDMIHYWRDKQIKKPKDIYRQWQTIINEGS